MTQARLDEEKGRVKGKHFCHPKVTWPGLSAGDRGCQQDGCSYYCNTGNNSHWENGTMLWFLVPSQSEGRKESGVSWRYSFGTHMLLAFCILGLHSGKNNFCHFNISLCCLNPNSRMHAIGWENLLISEEKTLKRTRSAFKVSFPNI